VINNEKNEKIAGSRQIAVDAKQLKLYGMNIEGREFTQDDESLEFYPVIINQRLADQMPGNPIGQKVILGDKKLHEIIGIASNTNFPGESYREGNELYYPRKYDGRRESTLLLKMAQSPSDEELTVEVINVDPRINVKAASSVSAQFYELSMSHRFSAYLAGAITFVSLLMVAAGVFGMVSYMINLRQYELGVKLAMGAGSVRLLKSQLVELALPITTALCFAFALAFFVLGYTRTIPQWVFAIDWIAIATVIVLLALISFIASYLPVRQVLKADPIKALRSD